MLNVIKGNSFEKKNNLNMKNNTPKRTHSC